MNIPEERYICEDVWNDEFELAMYDEKNEVHQLQADHTTWEKMIDFSSRLSMDYGLGRKDWYRFLWTSIDGEDGSIYLNNGTRFVNRIDFWLSKKPWGINDNKSINDATRIIVAWDDQEDCNDKEKKD